MNDSAYDLVFRWAMREEALKDKELEQIRLQSLSQRSELEIAQEELAAAKLGLAAAKQEEQTHSREELEVLRAEYETRLEEESAKSKRLSEELKRVLSGGEEALKAATMRVEEANAIEGEMKSVSKLAVHTAALRTF